MQNSKPAATVEPVQRYNRLFITGLLVFFGFMGFGTLQGGVIDFEDHLLAHVHWVAADTWLRLNMGDRVFAQVVVGREGWLDYVPNLTDYQNLTPLTTNDFATIESRLAVLSAQAAGQGAVLVVVVAPNKDTIYPEYLPPEIPRVAGPSQLDGFLEYMRQNSRVPVVDLRPALLQAKAGQELYYKTDTHWNIYGAHVGYETLLQSLPYNLKPYPLSSYSFYPPILMQMDLARLFGADFLPEARTSVYFPQNVDLKNIPPSDSSQPEINLAWNPNPALPNLVMYHDSFGTYLVPFLANNFKNSVFVLDGDRVDYRWMRDYQPQIVVLEVVERNLRHLLVTLPANP